MIKAHNDNILIRPIKRPVTRSGLIYSDDKSDPVERGIVISVGNKIIDIKEGDLIIFLRANTIYPVTGGTTTIEDQKEVCFVRYKDCLAILNTVQ